MTLSHRHALPSNDFDYRGSHGGYSAKNACVANCYIFRSEYLMFKRLKQISLRPIPSAHLVLPAVIVVTALLLTHTQPCKEGPQYGELAWVTITGTAMLWANHLAIAPVSTFTQVGRLLLNTCKDALLLVFWFVLLAIPLAVVTPTYQCYTSRTKASEVALAASTLRSQVEERARANGTLKGSGQGLVLNALNLAGRTITGLVSQDGEIIAIGEDPPAVIILSPQLSASAVTWKCRGYPTKVVPMQCRGET